MMLCRTLLHSLVTTQRLKRTLGLKLNCKVRRLVTFVSFQKDWIHLSQLPDSQMSLHDNIVMLIRISIGRRYFPHFTIG